MQVGGHKLERYAGEHVIYRDLGNGSAEEITLRIAAMPPGWREDAYTLFPEPQAPETGAVEANPATKKMEPVVDAKSPEYLRALLEHDRTISAYVAYHSLEAGGGDVGFDATPPAAGASGAERRKFYEAVREELTAVFGAGELLGLVQAIHAISNVAGADIELAERRFFRLAPDAPEIPGESETGAAGVHGRVPGDADLVGEGVDAGAVGGDASP